MIDRSPAQQARPSDPPEVRRGVWIDFLYFWRLIRDYLRVEPAIGLLLILLLCGSSVVVSYVGVRSAQAMGHLTDALVARSYPLVFASLETVFLLFLVTLTLSAVSTVVPYAFRIRFRSVLTRRVVDRWFLGRCYYDPAGEAGLDNIEQRIQEDVFLIAEGMVNYITLPLGIGTSLVLWTGVLLESAGQAPLPLLGVTIPGDYLIVAILWSVIFTAGAHWVGRAITAIETIRHKLEADFRRSLANVRLNGEAIAFERGGAAERARALHVFTRIWENWWRLTAVTVRFTAFTGLQGVTLQILPILMCLPRIFAGTMTIGQLTVVTMAFSQVTSALSAIANSYRDLAILRASLARIRLLDAFVDAPRVRGAEVDRTGTVLSTDGMAINLPDGRRLLDVEPFSVPPGERLLVRGPSGCGKSTLLRAFADIWPFGAGRATVPQDAMFLPQRSHMPEGSLAGLLSYPSEPDQAEFSRYAEALQKVGLASLAGRLADAQDWRTILSPGEQQRIAAARALVRRPPVLFLDEATSGLDSRLERQVYTALTEQLPGTTIVSVAHRPSVTGFHSCVIDVTNGKVAAPRPLSPQERQEHLT